MVASVMAGDETRVVLFVRFQGKHVLIWIHFRFVVAFVD